MALAASAVAVGIGFGLSGCAPSADDFDQQWRAQQRSAALASASSSSSTARPTPTPTPTTRSTASPTPEYAFPVKAAKARFGRYHHDYPAADIFAPCGTAAVATTDGVVSEVSRKDVWSSRNDDGAIRGGLSVSIIGKDGVRYYGSHLRSIPAEIVPGRAVQAGDSLGKVGNTGDARGIACHLHYGISPACGKGDWATRRGTISPYRFLKAWQAGKELSPAKAVRGYQAEHGCAQAGSD